MKGIISFKFDFSYRPVLHLEYELVSINASYIVRRCFASSAEANLIGQTPAGICHHSHLKVDLRTTDEINVI